MAENTGPAEAAKGLTEDVKGKAKEAAGTVFGRDDLVDEGRAQQDKAADQRQAAEHEAKAEKKRMDAENAEAGQADAQRQR
ncbi:CsbD family protein [Tsukamurella sp. 8F]|uniref:microaggregate-binding protein 1 n=1 Tax=unclassified Tsukamurella TaxID=2633480 RepID=UPI0023B92D6E|nr:MULTISPECIES: CsbD family protein [unclassified Tsukamurella]MDF0532352.1 CsbD family protein [Tsukamurella sp. 8J]MDF0588820.1 CsbD family protein [Tsukamurella sp. 8F]